MNDTIAAVILSGGASRRMEQPKGLLMLGTKTFLRHIGDVAAAAAIGERIIVLGADHEAMKERLGWFDGTIVVNAEWETGQLSSIQAGIAAVDRSRHSGVLLWPVDHPLVSAALVAAMAKAFEDSKKPIVVPVCCGRRGHPIILSRSVFDEVLSADGSIGLRAIVHAHAHEICEVPTEEEGVLINIDTPEEYRRFVMAIARPL